MHLQLCSVPAISGSHTCTLCNGKNGEGLHHCLSGMGSSKESVR